jgi:hypothetical protein
VAIDAVVRQITGDVDCLGPASAIRALVVVHRRAAAQHGYKSSAAEAGASLAIADWLDDNAK